jgi:Putative undecaprenyl diphosphate synthase
VCNLFIAFYLNISPTPSSRLFIFGAKSFQIYPISGFLLADKSYSTDSKQTWQPPASGRLKKCQQTSQLHLLIASGRNFESKMSWIRESTLNWLQMFCVKVVRTGNIPRHVAFIMDGNRRFATKTNVQKVEGHTKG